MHLPQKDIPRKQSFPAHTHSGDTLQCRSHRKSLLISVFYHQFLIENHSSSVLGLQPAASGENSSPKSRLPDAGIWSPILGAGNVQMSYLGGEKTELSARLSLMPLVSIATVNVITKE